MGSLGGFSSTGGLVGSQRVWQDQGGKQDLRGRAREIGGGSVGL